MLVEAKIRRPIVLVFSILMVLFQVMSVQAQVSRGSADPFDRESLQKVPGRVQPLEGLDSLPLPLNTVTPDEIERGKAFLQGPFQENRAVPPLSGEFSDKNLTEKKPENRKGAESPSQKEKTTKNPFKPDHFLERPAQPPHDLPVQKEDIEAITEDSPFEIYLREDMPAVAQALTPFGYDFFQHPPANFAPMDETAVSPDYLLGTGDEIQLTVWGKINTDLRRPLDRDGKIILPQLGAVHLAGLTFTEAREVLEKEFSRFYKSSEVKINVSMGRLRTIRVFVVGKVKQPGSYTISSFSTLMNALFASGGPSALGSMRDIQVKRQGKTVVHFDLYDLLLKGEKEGDIPLVSGDVIFIPEAGPRIGISGKVRVPALYETQGNIPLSTLIDMAGGMSATGYLQRIQVERIFENTSKIILDVDLGALGRQTQTPLQDGDLVTVFSIDERISNAVTLKGNVVRPGVYEWTEGFRVRDLFKGAEDFLPETFLEYALIERLVPPDGHKTYLTVGLKKLLFEGDETENILLQAEDKVVVFNRWDLMEKKKVQLNGAVNRPGLYEHRSNMRLSDLLKLAGGLERPNHPESYLSEGMVLRKMQPDFHEEKLTFDFHKALINEEASSDLVLQPSDEVFVFDQWEMAQEKTVRIAGAVHHPGRYVWAKNMRMKDLLSLAGGVKYYAFLDTAELTRISPTPQGPKTQRIPVDLQKAIAGDFEANIFLEPDDYFTVRSVPEWELYRTVHIEGEVRFPGVYTSKKGERLSSLLERAGGLTENAYLKGAIFTRKSVQELQQRQLDDAIDRLEQQLISRSANTIEAALTPEAAMQHKASMGQRDALIAKMRSATAKGRMSIDLTRMELFKGSPSDLVLEEGDVLTIPERPQQVQVIGAVFNQTSFIFDEKMTVAKYLDKAGGLTEDANGEAIYILKVDGTAYSQQQSKGFLFWKKELKSSRLDPGDTVVVPERLDRIVWLREVKDMTQILYQMAVTAGVLIVAF